MRRIRDDQRAERTLGIITTRLGLIIGSQLCPCLLWLGVEELAAVARETAARLLVVSANSAGFGRYWAFHVQWAMKAMKGLAESRQGR